MGPKDCKLDRKLIPLSTIFRKEVIFFFQSMSLFTAAQCISMLCKPVSEHRNTHWHQLKSRISGKQH